MIPRNTAIGEEAYLTLSTATPVQILAVPIEQDSITFFEIQVLARRTTDSAGKVWRFDAVIKRRNNAQPEIPNSNVLKTTGAEADLLDLLNAAVTISTDNDNIVVTVQSIDGSEVDWSCLVPGTTFRRVEA